MTKQKRFFLYFAIVFFALLFYASFDIATRTTFPGGKSQLKERINEKFLKKDSLNTDTGGFNREFKKE